MNLPAIFKRKNEVKENDIITIEIPDIKQYLVNEFDRANNLIKENKRLKMLIEESEEIKIKYDATVITLDEYKKRLDEYELIIKELEQKIEDVKQDKMKAIDDKNSLIIKLNQLGRTKDDVEKRLIEKYNKELQEILNCRLSSVKDIIINKKGVLSKSYVKDIFEQEMETKK